MDFLKHVLFAFVALSVVIAGACGFDPSIKDGGYQCAADRSCPTGYVCAADNKCYRPGAGPPAIPDGGGSSSGTPPVTQSTILMADVSGLEGGDMSGVDLVLTAKLVPASSQEVRVDWKTVDDAAKAPDDYTAANGTIVFPPGSTSQTITIKVKGDRISEPNELLFVELSKPVNAKIDAALENGRVRATILNDDTPGLVVDDVTVTEGDTGTTVANVTVTLTGPFPNEVTVNYATKDDTAVGTTDFQTTTGTLTFAPGEATKIVPIPIVGDLIHEKDKNFFLDLSNAVGAPLLDGQAQITLKDNDAVPALTIDDVATQEGNTGSTTLTFTVTASRASAEPMKVSFATANGTATASDYSAASGTLDFEPGQLTQTISVTVNGDTLDEDNENFTVTLSTPVGATLGAKVTGTGIITDDDDPPLVTIEDVSANEGNAGTTTFPFTVRLSAPSSKAITVAYATSNGTATAPEDYVAVTAGMLTIPAGSTSATATITVNGDVLDEGVQTFNVTISAPSNATLGTKTVGVGTILNDDSVDPKITINDVTVSESAGTMTFTVTLEKNVSQDVSVNYATGPAPSGVAATEGTDYAAKSGTLTFPGGMTTPLTQSVTIDITNDGVYEGNETFAVDLSGAVGGNISDAQGIGTIQDNESPPMISIASATVAEGNVSSLAASFVVTLSVAASTPVTVSYATTAGTATAGTDYQTTSGVLTFAPGETTASVDVQVNGDLVDEDDETFTVTLTNPSANATLGTATATGSIQDDDAAPTIAISDVTAAEGGQGATPKFEFVVTLSAASSKTITVSYTTANGTATAGSDYSMAMGTVTFPAGEVSQKVEVTVTGDTTNEANETFTVNLSSPTNATIADGSGTGTIQNDDSPLATVSISDAAANEGGTLTFTVTLSGSFTGTATVDWTLVDITTSPSDHGTPLSGTVTFTPASKTQTISITATNDTLNELPETFEIRLSNPTLNTEIFDGAGVGTINADSNDPQPTVSFKSENLDVLEGTTGTTTTLTYTVLLSTPSGRVVTVDYATYDGQATVADNDYVPKSGTLTFQPGETSKTIAVTIIGDATNEKDETVNMRLENPQGATLAATPTTKGGKITNDDP